MHVQIYFYLYIEVNNCTTSKVSKFHMWNVKQKDDGIDQNTLHCSYGEYVTTNEQTCCPDFASLPCPLKRLVKVSWLEKSSFSFITTTLLE